MESERQKSKQEKKNSSRFALVWLLILLVLLIWNGFSLWPKSSSEVEVPYTILLEQLKANNIEKVGIDGEKIGGTFISPFLWPKELDSKVTKEPGAKSEEKGDAAKPKTYTRFFTIYPQAIGDPNLLPLLEEHKVIVDVKSSTRNWFVTILASWLPLALLLGFFLWMGSRVAGNQRNLFSFGRSRARRYNVDESIVKFEDVAGAKEAKSQLQQEVDFLTHPKKYYEIGAKIPRGILLIGPPGTGKTLMARAVAGEAGVPFFSISASEFVEMFVGVGASRVRDLFKEAKESAPSIVFIDELDAVARRRGAGMGTVNDEREQTLNQLLVEMDGFDERQEVIILAATNRPDVLDPALLRPGRFDRQVVMALPDREGREGILKIHSRRLNLGSDVDLSMLARTTTGMSGADLANLCNEAALVAAMKNHKQVTMSDFEEAQDKVLLGEKRQLLLDPKDRRIVAYHEAGHAIVAWFTPAADEVNKVTIIPHGMALGVTEQLPGEDQYNYSRTYLIARLAVMLGGRGAEEIAIGDITTGAENDLVEATRLARRMVTRWGMGNLGLLAFRTDEEHPFLGYELSRGKDYSESTASVIDQNVKLLLEESHDRVLRLLKGKRSLLDNLAEALLQEETIGRNKLLQILGPRHELVVDETKEGFKLKEGVGA